MLHRIGRILDIISILAVLLIVGGSDNPRLTNNTDHVRLYTREIEFDYPNWVWDAAWGKVKQASIGASFTFDRETGKQIVFDYLRTMSRRIETEHHIEQIYADPNILDKETASEFLRSQRDKYAERQKELAPFA